MFFPSSIFIRVEFRLINSPKVVTNKSLYLENKLTCQQKIWLGKRAVAIVIVGDVTIAAAVFQLYSLAWYNSTLTSRCCCCVAQISNVIVAVTSSLLNMHSEGWYCYKRLTTFGVVKT